MKNLKLIFGIVVVAVALILVIFKVVTVEQITENWVTIGTGLLAIYGWLEAGQKSVENAELKEENEKLKEDVYR